MTFVAALATGVAVYLAVGFLTGSPPELRLRTRPRTQVSRQQLWLLQAGVDLTPRQFWAGSAICGLAAFGMCALVTGTPAVAAVPAIALGLLPRAHFARQRARRMREVQDSWPDGLRNLVSSIAAGMSLPQAIVALVDSGPEPLRRAFARFPLLSRMLGVVPALEIVKEELADPTSDRVIEVLILAYERGGSIVMEILRHLAEATTKDIRTTEEIETSALEQKINARVVFVLPWLVLVLLTAQPGAFRDFYQSAAGLVVVGIGAVLSLLGLWLVTRLGRDPVEERVFGGGAAPLPGEGTRP